MLLLQFVIVTVGDAKTEVVTQQVQNADRLDSLTHTHTHTHTQTYTHLFVGSRDRRRTHSRRIHATGTREPKPYSALKVLRLSRHTKELKSRARCCHIDLSQSEKLMKQQVQNTEETEHAKDIMQRRQLC